MNSNSLVRPIVLLTSLFIIFSCFTSLHAQYAGIAFERKNEPKEAAFSILVPKGWHGQGGIFRISPLQAGGPLNSLEAKCDLIYEKDQNGTVSFHILPDIVYAHVGIGGGFFPPGQYYQGAQVRQLVGAQDFLRQLFPMMHPNVSDARIISIKNMPGEKLAMDRGMAYGNQILAQIGMPTQQASSDAAAVVFEYSENGIHFREIVLTGIINTPAALTWKNTRTLAFRAPAAQFNKWRPVMDIMRFSVQFNMQWILKESQGQRERAEIVKKVFDEMRRIDAEIVSKTTVNREEIMNDNFLVLTGQEEYVNPHTGEVEQDTDAYKYRWKTASGDVYYTDREDENPNIFLHQTNFKRTSIRKRRNE